MQEILLKLTPMKSETQRGQRIRWRAVVMVGDGSGDVGFAQKIMKTQERAVMCATGKAYRQRFHIALGSWELRNVHTIPFYVIGIRGSVRVHLKPAPEGTGFHGPTSGVCCPPIVKKILRLVGVKDCLVLVEGNARLLLNLIQAVHKALCDLDSNRFVQ